MGFVYALTTIIVLLVIVAFYGALASFDQARRAAALMCVVGLAFVGAGAIGRVTSGLYRVGYGREYSGTDPVALGVCIGLGLLVGATAVAVVGSTRVRRHLSSLLAPADPDEPELFPQPTPTPETDDDPTRWIWLGLLGLVLVIAANTPSPLKDRLGGREWDRASIALWAFEALVVALAAVALVADRGSLGAPMLLAMSAVGTLAALGTSWADQEWLRGLLNGIAVVVLIPALLIVIRTTIGGHPLPQVLLPVVAGVLVIALAGLGEGLGSRPTVHRINSLRLGPITEQPFGLQSCSPLIAPDGSRLSCVSAGTAVGICPPRPRPATTGLATVRPTPRLIPPPPYSPCLRTTTPLPTPKLTPSAR
ncbi:MAG: hypothetical protein QOG53_2220 [Frankiales bacterium]|jgi:hypothetical protein|nr:hypothetical protein [Frankiales bacterium]